MEMAKGILDKKIHPVEELEDDATLDEKNEHI